MYADVDGDGDEDAAAGLQSEGGQMFASSWHIWLWQEGKAVQLTLPVAYTSRCEGTVESVKAKPGTFVISMVLTDIEDSCSMSGSVPITYEVAVRDGWPVRVSPEFGPIDTCNPRFHSEQVVPPGEVRLHTAPNEKSPKIGDRVEPKGVFTDNGPYFVSRSNDRQWVLVSAVVEGSRQVCGWARRSEIFGG